MHATAHVGRSQVTLLEWVLSYHVNLGKQTQVLSLYSLSHLASP